jgi:hypothetical protein
MAVPVLHVPPTTTIALAQHFAMLPPLVMGKVLVTAMGHVHAAKITLDHRAIHIALLLPLAMGMEHVIQILEHAPALAIGMAIPVQPVPPITMIALAQHFAMLQPHVMDMVLATAAASVHAPKITMDLIAILIVLPQAPAMHMEPVTPLLGRARARATGMVVHAPPAPPTIMGALVPQIVLLLLLAMGMEHVTQILGHAPALVIGMAAPVQHVPPITMEALALHFAMLLPHAMGMAPAIALANVHVVPTTTVLTALFFVMLLQPAMVMVPVIALATVHAVPITLPLTVLLIA